MNRAERWRVFRMVDLQSHNILFRPYPKMVPGSGFTQNFLNGWRSHFPICCTLMFSLLVKLFPDVPTGQAVTIWYADEEHVDKLCFVQCPICYMMRRRPHILCGCGLEKRHGA